jgi:POT family proton-dependent oligopeptide transporter
VFVSDIVSDHEMPEHYSSGYVLGHPKGLYVLFLTEMWERFSYYGMRTLLIFYLTKHFLFADGKAALIYGAYTALVYLVPVIGGMLADRYLGSRKAVTYGAILLVLGHFGMAFEGPPALVDGETIVRSDFHLQIFFLSLALIISGVAFLKANISTIVGALYSQDDPRREGGFTIFYMGINIGAFVATLACGYLGERYGWRYGFGLAGIGMLIGLIIFLKGQHLLEGHAEPPDAKRLKEKVFVGLSREVLIYLSGVAMVLVCWQLVQHQALVGQLLGGFGILVVLGLMAYATMKCEPQERDRIFVAAVLIFSSVLFWALFEQAGSSLNLLTDRAVDRVVLGWEVPATWFQSLNAGFIFTMAPIFAFLWVWLSKRNLEPSTPVKFALGLLQVGLGFLVLVIGMKAAGDGPIALVWLVLLYLLHTTGELCLSPVGLSMITKLSPARIVGMMMGIWFLASAGANFVAGLIAKMTSDVPQGGEVVDLVAAKSGYIEVYSQVGWYAIGAAVALLVISPLLRKGMHGVH